MRAILQRVASATVRVDQVVVGSIGQGILALVGVERGDTEKDALITAAKVAGLRIFEDERGKMNLSLQSSRASTESIKPGEILVVSQFTLAACVAKGRRPSFHHSAAPDEARHLLQVLVRSLREAGLVVEQGKFGAEMKVELINDGPVTFVVETRDGRILPRQA